MRAPHVERSIMVGSLGLILALTGYACGSGGATATTGAGAHTGSTMGTGAGGSHANSGGGGGLFVNHGAVVSLAVQPGPVTITVVNGTATPTAFTAVATYADKTTGAVDADWSFDRADLAAIDPTGALTPNGTLGGKGTLTASFDSLQATAAVTILLSVSQDPANLSAADEGAFGSPDTNPSGTLLYPYDQTVFARGILAPELMWSGGAAGDTYLVHLSETYVDATIYVTADPPSRFTVPADVWTELTQSNAGEPVQVDVQRASGGQAHQAMTESWTIAQGSLRGSIYYWSVSTGQLMQILPGAASPVVVFDSGPNTQVDSPPPAGYDGYMPPWETGGGGKRCVACHTVSKDGSTAVAVFERKGSAPSPWGTIDLTAGPPDVVQMSSYATNTLFLGLSPDGSYAVHNDVGFTFGLTNAKTGAAVPSALDGMTAVADPSFSPDGSHLAFAGDVVGSYPVEYTQGNLHLLDFAPATATFSNGRKLIDAGGQAVAFPSFSPDSAWVLYQKGDYSRAKYGTSSVGHDDLYMADVAGQVGELPLATASGANLPADNLHLAYQPTVNPISVGGYIWVVFVSPRDYGNEMLAASNPTYENRKQLWVAAIDANPQPGKDPSHPAFWLPGQDLTTINMSGYWALEACQQTGASCDQGYECCSGFCQADGAGNLTCVPTPTGCSQTGDACTAGTDCCNAPEEACIGGFCSLLAPN